MARGALTGDRANSFNRSCGTRKGAVCDGLYPIDPSRQCNDSASRRLMSWFPVDDRFHSHPKAAAASLAALGLWTLAGSWVSDHLQDGNVPDHMIPSLSRGATELADELVTVGLWRRTKAGYRFHQWHERNRTRSDVLSVQEKKSIGGALGNHRRWHANKVDPECRFCVETHEPEGKPEPTADRTTDRSTDGGSDRTANPPIPIPIPETKSPPKPPAGGKKDHNSDPAFAAFWAAYPRREAKPAAYKAWLAALKRGHSVEQIESAARRYCDDPRRKPDFTAHASTWLNQERYLDRPDSAAPRMRPLDNFWDA